MVRVKKKKKKKKGSPALPGRALFRNDRESARVNTSCRSLLLDVTAELFADCHVEIVGRAERLKLTDNTERNYLRNTYDTRWLRAEEKRKTTMTDDTFFLAKWPGGDIFVRHGISNEKFSYLPFIQFFFFLRNVKIRRAIRYKME